MDANKVEWMLKQRANSNGDAMVVLSRYIKQLEKYRLNALKHAVFCRTMEPFFRINLTIEEFVLLKAIIYSHSAIPELSERGKILLGNETSRYSNTLMKHLQSRLGAAPGAKKYAEIISLVDCLFHAAQRQQELHIFSVICIHRSHVHPPYVDALMFA
ncbi:ligand-binding domain of nuclear hormone receptor domain-containing protein [Ditylenchus destructor]|uniref:Ligand-binding domain of nuclear hormone receptor domain-containing protein n=1 Tax=Ditylenchus destructor TaxID=166010 RepID=A0AAD4N4W3_9BILA|nr:ligand-binding domain of nuclear hormone receptor domain-containing protein [Ditylenchus destructor]